MSAGVTIGFILAAVVVVAIIFIINRANKLDGEDIIYPSTINAGTKESVLITDHIESVTRAATPSESSVIVDMQRPKEDKPADPPPAILKPKPEDAYQAPTLHDDLNAMTEEIKPPTRTDQLNQASELTGYAEQQHQRPGESVQDFISRITGANNAGLPPAAPGSNVVQVGQVGNDSEAGLFDPDSLSFDDMQYYVRMDSRVWSKCKSGTRMNALIQAYAGGGSGGTRYDKDWDISKYNGKLKV